MGQSKEAFMEMRESENNKFEQYDTPKKLNLFLQPVEETSVYPIESKTLLTTEKSDLSEIASQIVEAVDDGFADPLDTYIMAKKGSYVFDSIVEAMKGKAKIPEGKNYAKHGCEIREGATGVRYYFESCNDPIWNELNMQMVALKEKLSEREKWLKGFTKTTEVEEIADTDTGEIIQDKRTIHAPVKMGGQSLILTLK
ncbi:MAG: hypothetical protein JWR05_3524 [Mucilaginibacter sp.]|nr:hypothetical protein [Mucilaginibacter sp.]